MLTLSAPFIAPLLLSQPGSVLQKYYCSLAWLTEIFLHDLHLAFHQIVTPELLMSA